MILSISEIQKIGIDMLREVAGICERNNIRWFMAYGSLLGAIRHHGPIPWDSDIDIYIPESDLQTFLSIMEKELPAKYWVDYRKESQNLRAFPRIGLRGYETEILHIDVYRLGGLPSNPIKLKLFTQYSRILFVTWKSKTLDINYYYPDLKRRFVSKTVKLLTFLIPLGFVIRLLDKQANRIPFDEAEIVASPLTTQSRKRMHNRSVFSESILVQYGGYLVRVPREYIQYLETQFGDWKAFPSQEEQDKGLNQKYEVREIEMRK